jgi:hypothetical protein
VLALFVVVGGTAVVGNLSPRKVYLYMGYAFRAFNTHGRALFTLAHRAMAGQNEDDYLLADGDRICSTANIHRPGARVPESVEN